MKRIGAYKPKELIYAGAVILLVGGIGMNFMGNTAAMADIQTQRAALEKKLADVKLDLDKASVVTETVGDKKVIVESLSYAKEFGEKIADAQNQYGMTMSGTRDVRGIAESIDPLLAGDSKNARVPWYVGNPADNPVWKFETNYGFVDNTVPVLWTCRDKDNNLLAFTFAKYDSVNKLFFDFNRSLTRFGMARQQVTVEPKSPYNPADPNATKPATTPAATGGN